MDPEVWQVVRGLIASSPLAAVLLLICYHLWKRLREVEDAKDAVYERFVAMLRDFMRDDGSREEPK